MLYFAYGSNLDPGHLRRRCPDVIPLRRAVLPGWKLAFRYRSTSFPGGSAADIISVPGDEVWGALYRITGEDLSRLDEFEDLESGGYRRIEVEPISAGERLVAWTYEVQTKLPRDYRPTEEYRQLLENGARLHGLPETYLTRMSALARQAPPLPEADS